ncbi:MAG TPA: DNA-directed RNA polymerase subunit alpha [Armatimonadetes bacterium]|nr:DNA-directed RNA polymerase subunit alpha [Armatimonadota bacterium]
MRARIQELIGQEPHINCVKLTGEYGKFLVEPLPKGYGITLGNALRRVILSSIPGVAVTAARIDGITHEFTTLPGVKEDVTEIILNLKDLAIRVEGGIDTAEVGQQWEGRIAVEGEGEVTGADVILPSELEVINPEVHIATVTEEGGKLVMDLVVQYGRGYLPVEKQDLRHRPLGTIPVDAIFSPIRRVNHMVEATRVGQQTDFDRLVLEVWTNGAITPNEAVSKAARILAAYLGLFYDFEEREVVGIPEIREEVEEGVEWLDAKIEELEFSVRTYNCLKKENINTVRELIKFTADDLLGIRNFGRKSLAEVEGKLAERGLSLRSNEE